MSGGGGKNSLRVLQRDHALGELALSHIGTSLRRERGLRGRRCRVGDVRFHAETLGRGGRAPEPDHVIGASEHWRGKAPSQLRSLGPSSKHCRGKAHICSQLRSHGPSGERRNQ